MKLHFEDNLDYQLAAIESVAGLFNGQETCRTEFTVTYTSANTGQSTLGLADSDLGIGNRLQLRNGLAPSTALQSGDFTIEMETGTGKTYVYLRTIFELHKRYNFTKFVIVVPSVAIKEGVYKTLQITREHFENLYPGAKGYEYSHGSTKEVKAKPILGVIHVSSLCSGVSVLSSTRVLPSKI